MHLTFDVELYMPLREEPEFIQAQGLAWKAVLDTLRTAKVKVTCFTTGEFVHSYPDLFRQMVDDGHEIASHTMTHRPFNTLTRDEIIDEIITSKSFLERESGASVIGFRAPLGQTKDDHAQMLWTHGYTYDSSIAATHIPNHFRGLGSPKRLYSASFARVTREDLSAPLLEIPISVTRAVPIPCGGLWLSGLYQYHRLLPSLHRDPHVTFLHPYDFMDLRRARGAFLHDKVKFTKNNWKLLNWFSEKWAGRNMRLDRLVRESSGGST